MGIEHEGWANISTKGLYFLQSPDIIHESKIANKFQVTLISFWPICFWTVILLSSKTGYWSWHCPATSTSFNWEGDLVMVQKILPGKSSDILTDWSFVLYISIPMFNTPFKLITAAPSQCEHIFKPLIAWEQSFRLKSVRALFKGDQQLSHWACHQLVITTTIKMKRQICIPTSLGQLYVPNPYISSIAL
jgi:hypothetical protein